MRPDKKLIQAVADSLVIQVPAFVEKDYYVVQLLKELHKLEMPGYSLVFAGGTCLSKAYKNTMRFSEDVDLKFVATDEQKNLSAAHQRKCRKDMTNQLVNLLEKSSDFNLVGEAKKRNEGRFQNFEIKYPSYYDVPEYLRPHIQLELIDSLLIDKSERHNISSLLAEETGAQPEIQDMECVSINSIAAEKIVALLRRTALASRNLESKDDPRLIRHAYDLSLILTDIDTEKVLKLMSLVIKNDLEQFGSKHEHFSKQPIDELIHGLNTIIQDIVHEQRYNDFTGPLVYNSTPPSWKTVKSSLMSFMERTLFKLK